MVPSSLEDSAESLAHRRRWRWFTLPRMLTVFAGVVMALVVVATLVSLAGPDGPRLQRGSAASAAHGAASMPPY